MKVEKDRRRFRTRRRWALDREQTPSPGRLQSKHSRRRLTALFAWYEWNAVAAAMDWTARPALADQRNLSADSDPRIAQPRSNVVLHSGACVRAAPR